MTLKKISLIVLLVIMMPFHAFAEDDDEKEDEKKSITYTKKEKKKKNTKKSSSSSKSSATESSYKGSESQTSVDSAILVLLATPWVSCDYLNESYPDSGSFYDCSSKGRAQKLADATFWDDFLFEFGYGIEGASWQPGAKETDDQSGSSTANLLKYKTEGLLLQKSDIQLSYLGKKLFSFSDERPLVASKSQDELMQIRHGDVSSSYTKYTYGIHLLPLLEMFEVESRILSFIFSYRYGVNYEAFVGNATAQSDMEYLTKDATFSGGFVTSGAITIDKGESVSFKTLFEDVEHSFDLTELWGPTMLPLRIGMFESNWERPSDNKRAIEIDGKPVIFDTTFKTKGAFIEFGPRYPASEGFKMSMKFKTGNDNRVENSALEHFGIGFNEDYETLKYSESDLKMWYNYYAAAGLFEGDMFFLSFGCEYNERVWSFEVKYDDGTSESTEADKDVITKVYTEVKYLF